jgi:glycosyltransferase involved in cell wall biosynthesis
MARTGMKIMLIHNYYRSSAPSGEDAVAGNERNLLEENGVEIIPYEKFNDDLNDSSFLKRARIGLDYAWSRNTYDEVSKLLGRARPDVAHIHSVHPQISPSVYAACQEAGVPVVHTLHNYRYICPGALLQRNGKPCEECVGKLPFNALRYRCYRGSLAASGSLVWMIAYNRWRGTFNKRVNRYIALTEFAASRLAAGGLPANRIEIKPNFLPVIPTAGRQRQNYAVYVGRLTEEKGVRTLLSAWSYVTGLQLKIIGDGKLRSELEQYARESGVDAEFMGARSKDEVLSMVGSAALQVVPSEWYEGFPMVILEAYACATPVIASRIGSLAEIVHDGETGFHFEPGNPTDLALKVNELTAKPDLASRLGMRAREIFMERYTPEQNFKQLMGIYQRARDDFEKHREN